MSRSLINCDMFPIFFCQLHQGGTRLWGCWTWSRRFHHHQSPLREFWQANRLPVWQVNQTCVKRQPFHVIRIITGFHPNHPLDAAGSFPAPLRSESTIKHALATGEAKDLGEVALQSRLCRPRWWCVVPFFGGIVFYRQENEWKWVVWGIKTCQNHLKHKRTTQHLWGCLALNFEPMQMVAVCCPETWVFRTASWRYFAMPAMPIMPMCVCA